ncbi:MAG: malonyl-ACP O-methyltransferase BioC [Gammaproteobacteria bacterium]|nr:malonyl-ACP O-methyltransferase BioC [Gammaproteobacteria bacterium]MDH5630955.1 malonyl-ACP O-methyltransferase BioC [Gammaproteobacteria bacterium]
MSLDQQSIIRAFNRVAQSYQKAAFFQEEVASRTFERLNYMNIKPAKILDVGCATGYCSRELKKTYKKAEVFGVDIAPQMIVEAKQSQGLFKKVQYQVADANHLPFEDNQFDIVFSNLLLPWLADLQVTFKEWNRVLRPGGLLMFSTLGVDTLTELKQAWQQVDQNIHVNAFMDMHDVGDQVFNAGFENVVLDRDMITLTYQTLKGLMKDIKSVGAQNHHHNRHKGLTGKNKLQVLEKIYDTMRWESGELPVTCEVVYGHAWKKAGKPQGDYHTYDVSLSGANSKGK